MVHGPWVEGGVVEISSGAAQSYIETYYLQLKATRVSFIRSLTHLQKRRRISPDPLPVCLSPLYVDWGGKKKDK